MADNSAMEPEKRRAETEANIRAEEAAVVGSDAIRSALPTEEELWGEPPDGGLVAWLQVSGSFALFFNCWGVVNSFGVYQTYYELNNLKDVMPGTIAWIGSIQSFLLLGGGIVAGPLYDAGHFRGLITVGALMVVLGFLATSFCSRYWQLLLAQGLCIGAGTGLLYVPSLALLPQYFTTKRPIANGVVTSGGSLGGTIYPVIFQNLISRVGFGWTNRVLGLISLALGVYSLAVMRPRGKPRAMRSLVDWQALQEPAYLMYTSAFFCSNIGYFGPVFYLQAYALKHGLSAGMLAFYLVAILNAGSVVGRLLPAAVAVRYGALNMIVLAAASAAVVTMCWVAVDSGAGNVVFAVAYGFATGGIIALPPAVLVTITKDLSRLGTRLGMTATTNGLATLCGPPICGAILKATGSYLGVQLFSGFAMTGAAVMLTCLRVYRAGWTLSLKI